MSYDETKIIIRYDLPVGGSGCGNIRLISDSTVLTVEFEYRQSGIDWIGIVAFDGISSYRFYDEMHSQKHVLGSYDAIVEVVESDWISEIAYDEPEGISVPVNQKHHFSLYISNNGQVDVIADSFSCVRPRRGLLATTII